MARGGLRPGSGRPKGAKSGKREDVANIPADIKSVARKAGVSPLEYMLAVMNDDEADSFRRDRMAIAAAPYVHMKAAEERVTAKEVRQAAAEDHMSSGGRFSAPTPPPGLMN